MVEKPSISLPDDLYNRAESRTGPSFSSVVQDALRRYLVIEEVAEQYGGNLPDDWWHEALEEYVERRMQTGYARNAEADD